MKKWLCMLLAGWLLICFGAGLAESETGSRVRKVRINEAEAVLWVGREESAARGQLTVTIQPEEAADAPREWTSEQEEVVSVSSTGEILGLKPGSAVVTCSVGGGKYVKRASLRVRVYQAVTGISLSEESLTLAVGKSKKLEARTEPEKAKNQKVVWRTSDEAVAKVSEAGKIRAAAPGDAVITAETTDGSGLSAECRVRVVQPVEKVSLGKEKQIAVPLGDERKLTAEISPEEAGIRELKWVSSDEKVVTVDAEGMIRGVGKGKAWITAEATDGSNAKAGVTVTVDQFDLIFTDSVSRRAAFQYGSGTYDVTVQTKTGCVTIPRFNGKGWTVRIGKDVKEEYITVQPVKPGADEITVRAGQLKTVIKVYVAPEAFGEEEQSAE